MFHWGGGRSISSRHLRRHILVTRVCAVQSNGGVSLSSPGSYACTWCRRRSRLPVRTRSSVGPSWWSRLWESGSWDVGEPPMNGDPRLLMVLFVIQPTSCWVIDTCCHLDTSTTYTPLLNPHASFFGPSPSLPSCSCFRYSIAQYQTQIFLDHQYTL